MGSSPASSPWGLPWGLPSLLAPRAKEDVRSSPPRFWFHSKQNQKKRLSTICPSPWLPLLQALGSWLLLLPQGLCTDSPSAWACFPFLQNHCSRSSGSLPPCSCHPRSWSHPSRAVALLGLTSLSVSLNQRDMGRGFHCWVYWCGRGAEQYLAGAMASTHLPSVQCMSRRRPADAVGRRGRSSKLGAPWGLCVRGSRLDPGGQGSCPSSAGGQSPSHPLARKLPLG